MANGAGSRSQLAGEGRRVVELVSAEQHDAQLLAEVVPSGIAWSALGHEDGHDVCVSEPGIQRRQRTGVYDLSDKSVAALSIMAATRASSCC
jgi:hypothetical protein